VEQVKFLESLEMQLGTQCEDGGYSFAEQGTKKERDV
jgi:hypothetical protein